MLQLWNGWSPAQGLLGHLKKEDKLLPGDCPCCSKGRHEVKECRSKFDHISYLCPLIFRAVISSVNRVCDVFKEILRILLVYAGAMTFYYKNEI